MTALTHLLIIDPQNDFCDTPATRRPPGSAPALPVAGADADMQRLAGLIRAAGAGLAQITVTLDSHHRLDIAHPTFWQRGDGSEVTPFTPITAAQLRAGAFAPRDATARPRALAYLDALEARGRYTLMVWPVHCEIGSWGHEVHADVAAACRAWAARPGRTLRTVRKGENPWTEHYSALLAEVPDASDPQTQLNRALLDELELREPVERHVEVDGLDIQGWLIASGKGRRPTVVQIHGGPHTLYGWSPFIEFQVLAGAGISVFY